MWGGRRWRSGVGHGGGCLGWARGKAVAVATREGEKKTAVLTGFGFGLGLGMGGVKMCDIHLNKSVFFFKNI